MSNNAFSNSATPNKVTGALLTAGILMPVLYFAALFVAGALYPGFSHVRQVASDLGADSAPYAYATAFSVALVFVGLFGLAGSLRLFMGLRRAGASRVRSAFAGLIPAMPSLSLVQSGVFPLPSPHHSTFLLLLIGVFTPFVGAVALRTLPGTGAVRWTLYAAFVASLIVVSFFFGVGGVVTETTLGLWLRIWAAISLPTLAILCGVVRRRLT